MSVYTDLSLHIHINICVYMHMYTHTYIYVYIIKQKHIYKKNEWPRIDGRDRRCSQSRLPRPSRAWQPCCHGSRSKEKQASVSCSMMAVPEKIASSQGFEVLAQPHALSHPSQGGQALKANKRRGIMPAASRMQSSSTQASLEWSLISCNLQPYRA